MKKKTLLVVLAGPAGGHTQQMLKLVNSLGSQYSYDYVVPEADSTYKKVIKYRDKIFVFRKTRAGSKENLLISIIKQILACGSAAKIVKKSRCNAIIACGPNLANPICFVGKLAGKKIIFVESWSRINNKSLSGKFIYLFADLFFVQWPEMLKLYPRAICAGRIDAL